MTTRVVTLRSAVLPRATSATDAILVAASVGMIALAAQVSIPLPFTPVPITGQTFAVLLTGAVLGSARGVLATLLYLILGMVGLPFYAGGSSGIQVVMGATGGYLIGLVLAAMATGWLAERRWDRRVRSSILAMLLGEVLIFTLGVGWLMVVTGIGLAEGLALGLLPFLISEAVKLFLAGLLLPSVWRLVHEARED